MGATNYPYATIVNIAYCSAIFADRDISRYRKYRGGTFRTPDIYLPFKLVLEAQLLEWRNNNFPNDSALDIQANYVLGLCGQYLAEALRAMGNAGGIVINPTSGSPINIEGYREDFIVGTAGSLMDDGDTSYTIPLSGFIRKTVHFVYSGSDGTLGVDTGGAYVTNITYGGTYVKIDLNQPVRNGEIYEIWGLRATAGTVTGGGSSSGLPVPLPLQKGKFLSNDGSNLMWSDVLEEYTSADFEPDGVTVLDERLRSFDFDRIDWENVPTTLYLSNGDFTPITDGDDIVGFIINVADFNAGLNPDWKFKLFKSGQ